MTTHAELSSLVIDQTKRPDIAAITDSAIRTAILRAHHVDFFPRDVAEATLSYTPLTTTYFYSFANVSNLLIRNRAIKKVFGVDPITFRHVESFHFREVDDLYDADGVLRQSPYCLIGDTLRVYPTLASGTLSVYYYRNPDTSQANLTSWIADTYPEQVAQWAAAIVFARTGYAEMAREFQQNQINPFKEMLIASHLLCDIN